MKIVFIANRSSFTINRMIYLTKEREKEHYYKSYASNIFIFIFENKVSCNKEGFV